MLAVTTIAIGVAVASVLISQIEANQDRISQGHLNQLRQEVYNLMILSQEAAGGDIDKLEELPAIKSNIEQLEADFNESQTDIEDASRQEMGDNIYVINSNIDIISEQTERVKFLYDQLEVLDQSIPLVQETYTRVVDTMLRNRSPADQVAEAQAQVWRAERLLTSLNRILVGSSATNDDDSNPFQQAAEQFRQDVLVFNEVLVGMKEGNLILGISRVESAEARQLLEQVEEQFGNLGASIESISEAAPALAEISKASEQILTAAAALLQSTTLISEEINALADNFEKRKFSDGLTLVGTSIAVIMLFVLGFLVFRDTRENLVVTESANERNQEAILRLLDEIADLGEGDLTVHATVTEDFTGAIADSINYAIEQLRELVARVANTAEAVATSSNETRATSLRLSEASEHQAIQVGDASRSINEISGNLSKVSTDAEELATTAQSSVEVARNGAEVVQNTITGMNNIREQIQDTSKRIKRLGESSQEIGDIVSLINEIADQTNILALNASIQAAMAGEAGRGFAVVADEVQGLAERAASSTKQIENLVKTIQSDTNEAVASMEQTTAEVVRGAQLANNAGTALNDIQSTSENLATLILTIARETQDQSKSADRIVGSMKVIQDISSQTLEGTTESARAVGELSEQARELRNSIADFKLPDEDLPETNEGSGESSFTEDISDLSSGYSQPVHEQDDATDQDDDSFDFSEETMLLEPSPVKEPMANELADEPELDGTMDFDSSGFDFDEVEESSPNLEPEPPVAEETPESEDDSEFGDFLFEDFDSGESASNTESDDAQEDEDLLFDETLVTDSTESTGEFSFSDDDFLSFDLDEDNGEK